MARYTEPDHPHLNQTVRLVYLDASGVEVSIRGFLEHDFTGEKRYRIAVRNPEGKGADAYDSHKFDDNDIVSSVLDRHQVPCEQVVQEHR